MKKQIWGVIVIGVIACFVAGCGHKHIWVEATCTEPKTCSECGKTKGNELGHSVEEWATTVEPTCIAEGEQTGVCTVCGESVVEPLPTGDHVAGDWVVTQEATFTDPGIRTAYCAVCGEELEHEEFTLPDDEIEAQYKAQCVEYSYEEIARDPDNYKGTYAKYTGEVIQVLEENNTMQMRVNVTPTDYGYTDTIFVQYSRDEGESRILEGDIITIYGINEGTVSYESILGAQITIPAVEAGYIDIN